MDPLTKQRRQLAGQDRNHISTLEPAQHRRQESRVVVLGVMYPSAIPHPSTVTRGKLPPLPTDVGAGRSSDVIFYDPISSRERDERPREPMPGVTRTATAKPQHGYAAKGRDVTRSESIAAVACELERLLARNHRQEKWAAAAEGRDGMD
jgi:hypothetical protein